MVLSFSVAHSLILCIDDAEVALRVKKLLLASVGYDVLTANSAEEGFALFKQNPVALVVADHLAGQVRNRNREGNEQLKPEIPIFYCLGCCGETCRA